MSASFTKPETWHQCRKCDEIYLAYTDRSVCPACGHPKNAVVNQLPKQVVSTNITGQRSNLKEKREFQPNLNLGDFTHDKEETTTENSVSKEFVERTEPRKVVKKYGRKFIIFLAVWMIGLTILSLYLRSTGNEHQHRSSDKMDHEESVENNKRVREMEFLSRASSAILPLAQEFFLNGSPHILSQICRKRPRIVQLIAADAYKLPPYQANQMPVVVSNNVAWCKDTMILETVWKDSRERLIELVFVEEEGEWKIDWEAFSRSSTVTWAMFHSESEDGEGVFRFLVRARKTVKTDVGKISVAFYEPSLFHGKTAEVQTIPFIVDLNSPNGQLLVAALEARTSGKDPINSMYPQSDMPQTARVRVKIRRSNVDGDKVFTLEEVQACHWLGWDDPGIDLPSSP